MEKVKEFSVPNWFRFLILLLLLYFFFMAIGLMGGAFKLLGRDVAESLISVTSNPFTGLMIGILSTALVQSSSVTTSTVVGLVSGGALTIGGAVPIVMGANIGTSVTNAIVSLGHIRQKQEFERAFAGAVMHDFFNWMGVFILLPFELLTGYLEKSGVFLAHLFSGSDSLSFTSPLKAIVKPAVKATEHLLIDTMQISEHATGIIMIVLSFILLFTALVLIVKNMKAMMIERLEVAIDKLFGANPIFAIIVGMILTALVQSSSITTSLLVPLIGAGAMSLNAAFPITLGANVGTTITALLAALAGNVNGLAIAFVHLVFNLTGIALVYIFKPLRVGIMSSAQWLAQKATKDKKVALYFLVGVFYVLPLGIFGISHLFEW